MLYSTSAATCYDQDNFNDVQSKLVSFDIKISALLRCFWGGNNHHRVGLLEISEHMEIYYTYSYYIIMLDVLWEWNVNHITINIIFKHLHHKLLLAIPFALLGLFPIHFLNVYYANAFEWLCLNLCYRYSEVWAYMLSH